MYLKSKIFDNIDLMFFEARDLEGFDASPSPDQMFGMASVMIDLARRQGRFKHNPNRATRRRHSFFPKECRAVLDEETLGYELRTYRRIFGTIGKIGIRQWEMKLAEPQWLRAEDRTRLNRRSFIFEWNRDRVLRAQEISHTALYGPGANYSPGVINSRFVLNMGLPAEIDRTPPLRRDLSHQECAELARHVEEFSALSLAVSS